ncbi:MAG: D-amino acid aminotransferase [Burkholderiales bacterium]|nr:D-amino acid aminotransferase [Burkholderiales bacterium]
MTQTVYLNGEYMPLDEARVPVLDRGFIFGDGVYEVIPVYGRVALRLQEHLLRMQRSLDAIRLANPMDLTAWTKLVGEIIARNPWDDQAVYVQVTRGVAPRDHTFPAGVRPTVFVMANPMTKPTAEQREKGVGVITAEDFRWQRCDIKSVSLLANCMLRQLAAEAGCAEAVLLRDGLVTEASASNVFVVKDGVIVTPPKDHRILPGITLDLVIDLAREAKLPLEVRTLPEAELRAADEIWVSSSTREVLPVTKLDGVPVGEGKPGPMYARMYRLYQDYKARIARTGLTHA